MISVARHFKRNLSQNKPPSNITNWRQFEKKVRGSNKKLLQELPNFADSILVTGCQRSGTTIMARIFTQSENMVNYGYGFDDELDAALILSGLEPHPHQGRYCFQTTYLNDQYRDYLTIPESVKIVWVLRNPFDVVNSMLNHWSALALWDLYIQCGQTTKISPLLFPFNRLEVACAAYCGKISQLLELAPILPDNKLLVVNYEDLIEKGDLILPDIFTFADLEYIPSYASKLHQTNQPPIGGILQSKIEESCGKIYNEAKKQVFVSDK